MNNAEGFRGKQQHFHFYTWDQWFRWALDPVATASPRFTPMTGNAGIYSSGSGSQNVGLKSQFRSPRFARTENVLFSIRSATKQALRRILVSLFLPI